MNTSDLNKKEIDYLDNQIAKTRPTDKIYIKLIAVRDVKAGKTRMKVAENLHVNRITVGKWVKAYDEEGIEGLKPKYYNCGLKCRLSNEQLLKLRKILTDSEKNYPLKDVQNIIEKEFNVKYSLKEVWVITRKKLGLKY